MPKTVSADFLADLQAAVTRLATCIEIHRKDGRTLRLTNHDADIVVDDLTYRHDIPFSLSAIDAGSSLAVDTNEIILFADDVEIRQADILNGLYDYAEVSIFEVDYTAPAHGKMTLRRGWFGDLQGSQNKIFTFTITGLLKVLDFEVGRTVQPSCDADFGDKRCMVALDHSQIYSHLNRYHLGNWVYRYDHSLTTDFSVLNPSFEADGERNSAQTITGWTRIGTGPSYLEVRATSGVVGAFSPVDGNYMLIGSDDLGLGIIGLENGVYQNIDLVAQGGGLTTAQIDDGQIMVGYTAALLQGFYLLDPVRLRIEIRNGNNELIDTRDTGYVTQDLKDEWRERGHVFPLLPTARYARLFVYFRKDDGQVFNQAADKVHFWWWNHLGPSPYGDVVHNVKRIGAWGEDSLKLMGNSSFELNGLVANGNGPTIASWTTGSGNWWRVTNAANGGGLPNIHADFYLKGGDDSSGTQKTYTITQTKHLNTDFGLDLARVALGKFVGNFSCFVGWTDPTSAASVTIDWLNGNNVVVGTIELLSNEVNAAAPTWDVIFTKFVIPVTAVKARITFAARSPVGSGAAGVAFDDVTFHFYDAERPKRADPIYSEGQSSTVWSTTPGSFTIDDLIIWKAVGAFAKFDQVLAVPSEKVIRGTHIGGVVGDYETAAILWLSGNNAGLKNVVRVWSPATKDLKLYFKPIFPVQVGDRFMYHRTCNRRFVEDCVLQFGNGVNFRGFPHLPGKLE